MAFNPFHSFRKHQRGIFAALTILCMLTFVAYGGSSLADQWWTSLFGRSQFPTAVTIAGKKYDTRDLIMLREERIVANRYMAMAIKLANDNIAQDVAAMLSQLPQGTQNQVQQILMQRQITWLGYGRPDEYRRNLPMFALQLETIYNELVAAKKTTEADKVRLLAGAMQKEEWLLRSQKDSLYPDSDLYFGGGLSPEALADFLVWRHQADTSGIRDMTDEVGPTVRRETLGRLKNADSLAIEQRLNNGRGDFGQTLVTAVNDELRVRLAQIELSGFDPAGWDQPPALFSQQELYEYYLKNRTELNLKLLAVPVEKFLAEVKDKPAEEELRTLFDKHKEDEAAPFRETPGFKRPRRVKVEWVSASAESPHYRKLSETWLRSLVASTVTDPLMGQSLAVPVLKSFDYSTQWGTALRLPDLTQGDVAAAFHTYASLQKPSSAVSLIGQAFGLAAPLANPFVAATSVQAVAAAQEAKGLESAVQTEKRNRLPLAVTALSSGTSATPALALAGVVEAAARTQPNLPLDVVKAQFLGQLEEGLARDLLTASFNSFKKELEDSKGPPADKQKLIERVVKANGWTLGATADFRDQWDLADDPKLAGLKENYLEAVRMSQNNQDPKGRLFGLTMFFNDAPDKWKLFVPREMFGEKQTYLYWKTADEPAKVLSFDEARPKVEHAWRVEKARALAQKAADELAQKAAGDPQPVLLDAGKRYGTTLSELKGVARLKQSFNPRAGMGGQYAAYRVPEEIVEYPLFDFADRALELKDKNTTQVIADLPKMHYFVVALDERIVPTVKEFQKDTAPPPLGFRENALVQAFAQQKQDEHRRAVLDALRARARVQMNEDALASIRGKTGVGDE